MYLTSISATNLKGRTFRHDLTPCTLITGGNFTGKTAIAEAVRLVLLGYLPECGKRNSDTFEISSGAELRVSATTDTADVFDIRLWSERNSIKQSRNIDIEGMESALLDTASYFAMTDTERVNYVFSKTTVSERYTADSIIARLHRIDFGSEHSEAIQSAKSEVVEICRDAFSESTVQEALTALTEPKTGTLAADFAEWNRRAKDTEGTVRVLTELKLREEECSAETLTDLRNEEARIQELLNEAMKESGGIRARADEARRAGDRIRRINADLAEPEPKRPMTHGMADDFDLAGMKAEINRLDVELAKDPVLHPDADKKLQDARSVLAGLVRERDLMEKESIATQKELCDIGKLECCPFCKSKSKGWRAQIESAIQTNLKAQCEKLHACKKAIEAQETAVASAKERDEANRRILTERATMRDLLADIVSKVRVHHDQEVALERRNAQEQSDYDRAMTAYRTRQDVLRNELRTLLELPQPTAEELDEMMRKNAELSNRFQSARNRLRAAERLQNDLKRAQEAAAEHDLAQARADVIKAIGKELKSIKAEMVEEAFGDLLKTANELAGDLLLTPIAYHEGEIGRWSEKGNFIVHRVLSGTEQALTYLAIGMALSIKAPIRLMIVDELSRLTEVMQYKVLRRLRGLVATNRLDQVIAIVPSDDPESYDVPEEWSRIVMGA